MGEYLWFTPGNGFAGRTSLAGICSMGYGALFAWLLCLCSAHRFMRNGLTGEKAEHPGLQSLTPSVLPFWNGALLA